ncbi:MAG: hypothetical protein LBC20_12725 [Planctomycetaceae bacterium]|jgi:hypothetical protein|nr:hypothetical protein [Planctomycetaceae bacterium]
MFSINKIKSCHIQQLTDKQLVDLLKTLLNCETSKYDIIAIIDVPSNINAPDDGCDGYVEWDDKNKKTPLLTSSC